jgi:hypothetical protein
MVSLLDRKFYSSMTFIPLLATQASELFDYSEAGKIGGWGLRRRRSESE